MRIVEHCPYIGPAKNSMGAERVVEALTKGFLKLGHEVVMFVDPRSTNMPAPVVSEEPENFDIIHDHGHRPEFLAKFKTPWCSTIHGGGSDPEGMYWHNNPNYICVSDFICKMSYNTRFVHSCVEPDDFIYREKKGDYFLWLSGTDWGEGKGLSTAIRLAKKLKFRLKIAGTGRDQQVIDFIKRCCDDKIEYMGGVNGVEKSELIASAKALFFYSKLPDACPLVVAESLVSGTPIIGSTLGSLPELIMHNKTGILCSNELELTKAILNINKINPQDCRNYALDNFSNISACEKYLMYFEERINRQQNM